MLLTVAIPTVQLKAYGLLYHGTASWPTVLGLQFLDLPLAFCTIHKMGLQFLELNKLHIPKLCVLRRLNSSAASAPRFGWSDLQKPF